MIFENTLNLLKVLFKEESSDKKYIQNMKKILSKLNAQILKLEAQLKTEKDETRRKNINLRLIVISQQKRKGERLIQKRDLYPSRKDNVNNRRPELSPRLL